MWKIGFVRHLHNSFRASARSSMTAVTELSRSRRARGAHLAINRLPHDLKRGRALVPRLERFNLHDRPGLTRPDNRERPRDLIEPGGHQGEWEAKLVALRGLAHGRILPTHLPQHQCDVLATQDQSLTIGRDRQRQVGCGLIRASPSGSTDHGVLQLFTVT
jgi:hypothetical protein